VVLLLTFVAKEVLVNGLKNHHDSLASVVAQYREGLGLSTVPRQILNTQQQIEALRLQISRDTQVSEPYRQPVAAESRMSLCITSRQTLPISSG
jgi:hypothetical protein